MTEVTGAPRIDETRPRAMGARTSLTNTFLIRLLGSDLWPLLGSTIAVLRYTARSGAQVILPVQVAHDRGHLVVLAGKAEKKRWWRHFTTPGSVDVWHDGQWRRGTATVLIGRDNAASAAYLQAYPHSASLADATFVTVSFPPSSAPPAPLRGRPLSRSWFWVVTAAETLGFAVAACVGALTADAGAEVIVLSMLAAGAVEGAALGWGQATVLQYALPGLSRRRWVAATAAAAAVAYLIGLVPSTFADSMTAWPLAALGGVAAVLGCGLLASIGTAQWLMLRRHVTHAWRWIPATAAAWTVGLGVFLGFAMPLWQPGQPLPLLVSIGVAGGLLMAATTSAITGLALRRLLS